MLNDNNPNILQPAPSSGTRMGKELRKVPILSILIIGAILVMVLILAFDYFKIFSLTKFFSPKSISPALSPSPLLTAASVKQQSAIIAKVGEENIYQKDLDTELSFFPPQIRNDKKQQILEKITKDSITLQAAQEENLLTLDNTEFNSYQKDYIKRMKIIADIRQKIESKKDIIHGFIVAIWFFDKIPAKVGYEKGKEIAYTKITQLQLDVKNKKITIQQAAQQIKNDAGMAQLDAAYKTNAILEFRKQPKDTIVFDTNFDATIKNLQPGEISGVYLAKDAEIVNHVLTGKMIDAVYMFAQVTDKNNTGGNPGFNEWVTQKMKNYEIIYY